MLDSYYLKSKFDGETFGPEHDLDRLSKQLGRVKALMGDGQWRTLQEIALATGDPESSVSARLRDCRKEKHGGFIVDRRCRGDRANGLFEYQLRNPNDEFRRGVEACWAVIKNSRAIEVISYSDRLDIQKQLEALKA